MSNEHPLNTSDAEQAAGYEKTVQKRRSSVFQSRADEFDPHEGTKEIEGTESKDAKNATEVDEKVEEEPEELFDLAEYVVNLRKERKLWIETWRQRKAERKCLTAKKLSLQNCGQPLDLNVLSDSERAFIQARPNYERICENRRKLFDVSMKVATLNQLARKLNQKFILQMEEKFYDVTKRIIKISES